MSKMMKRRPSPALVVAILALVVAMAGTTYAAVRLAPNSVGTKQLKKNAVTGAKVKDGSLSGKDIKLATLGTVPSATKATQATSADSATQAKSAETASRATSATNADHAIAAESAASIAPPEASHVVDAPGEPRFLSGSANRTPPAGSTYPPVSFYKDREGIVHLEGVVQAGKEGSVPGMIFILPTGFRPANGVLIPFEPAEKRGILIGGTGASIASIDFSGAVYAPETEAGAIPLNGITFRAQG